MPARSKVIVRAALTAVVLGLLVALLATPRKKKMQAPGEAQRPRSAVAARDDVSPDGLVLVTASSLKATITRSQAKGAVVGAWASWCGSCQEDVPLLVALGRRYAGKIDVLLVSVDEPSTEGKAVEMLRGFGATLPSFVVEGPLEAFKAGLHPRWPGMLPATFLLDADAKVRYFWGGPVMEGEIVPILERYLSGERVDGEATFGLAPGAVTN